MRNLLVVVDMQNDFIDGSLGTKEAVAIVDNVIAEIAKYDTKDIFATRDTHPENYLETQEGKNLPVVHCVKGTDGWQINEKVKTALKDAVVICGEAHRLARATRGKLPVIPKNRRERRYHRYIGRTLHRHLCCLQCNFN